MIEVECLLWQSEGFGFGFESLIVNARWVFAKTPINILIKAKQSTYYQVQSDNDRAN